MFVAVLPGDGIGPEVMAQGLRVLQAVGSFETREAPVGGAAIDAAGEPLPKATLELCLKAGAVLFGAVGGPKWEAGRPEQALLGLRKALGVYANLRPVKTELPQLSPLKPEVVRGVDLVFVRELTGGIYFGEKHRDADRASDLCIYTSREIERVVAVAAELARKRRKKLASVDKANVLETSRLWRQVVDRVMRERYPDVAVEHVLVDACAMHLLRRPAEFDVLVTENMFGDILTDEASMLAGSMGLLPSASLGDGPRGFYEPIHGSAPDIAGKGIANPYAAILSVALMLRHSFALEAEAQRIEAAVRRALRDGVFTPDLGGRATTVQAGDAVLRAIADDRHLKIA
jgi:3-isopropylmalate dehydrogenase